MAAAHSVHTLKTGIVFNLYHAGTFACTLQSGNHVKVDVTTAYPHAPTVVLKVHPQRRGELFSMVLRVPAWAHGTAVTINQMMSGAFRSWGCEIGGMRKTYWFIQVTTLIC